MFNKSILLILVTAAFAVALPTGPIPNSTPTDLGNALSSNVKPPSLARRAASCPSNYTLTYCQKVLQEGDSFVPELLQSIGKGGISATGQTGLSCSPAQTADSTYALCSQNMSVTGLALDCVGATTN